MSAPAHTGRYCANTARALLRGARARCASRRVRVVDFGAANGNILDIAHALWGDDDALYLPSVVPGVTAETRA